MRTIAQEYARLDDFAAMEAGWLGGYGSVISPLVVAAANQAIDVISAASLMAPGTFPLEEGGIQVEWMIVDDKDSAALSLELVETAGTVNCESFALFIHNIGEDGETKRAKSDDHHTVQQGIDFAMAVLRSIDTPEVS